MSLCDEINDLIGIEENEYMTKGITSEDNEHNHGYEIDESGDGQTYVVNNHAHSIDDFQVGKYEEHTHTLEEIE